jgi:hypothetical protein
MVTGETAQKDRLDDEFALTLAAFGLFEFEFERALIETGLFDGWTHPDQYDWDEFMARLRAVLAHALKKKAACPQA